MTKVIATATEITPSIVDNKYSDYCSSSIDTTAELIQKLKFAKIKKNEPRKNLKEVLDERDKIKLTTLQHVSGYKKREKI